MTPRRAMGAIILVWIVVLMQAGLSIDWDPQIDARTPCNWQNVIHKAAQHLNRILLWAVTFFIIVPMYVKIGCTAWRLSKTEPHVSCYAPEIQAQQRKKLRERKLGTVLGLVLAVYLGCYIPQIIYTFATRALYNPPFPFAILFGQQIFNVIYKLQSVLNVFIYGWKNPTFRNAYLKMLGKKSHIGSAEIPLPSGRAVCQAVPNADTRTTAPTRATESTAPTRATESTAATRATESTADTRATESTAPTRATESTAAASTADTRATESTADTRATESTAATRATESTAEDTTAGVPIEYQLDQLVEAPPTSTACSTTFYLPQLPGATNEVGTA